MCVCPFDATDNVCAPYGERWHQLCRICVQELLSTARAAWSSPAKAHGEEEGSTRATKAAPARARVMPVKGERSREKRRRDRLGERRRQYDIWGSIIVFFVKCT